MRQSYRRRELTGVETVRCAALTAPLRDVAALRRAALHLAQEIGERLARLGGERVVFDVDGRHPVQAEIAEVVAQLAPGGECPALAPEVERQRPDRAGRRSAVLAHVIETGEAAVPHGSAQRFEGGAQVRID